MKLYRKNTHCSYCGERFDQGQPWPRTCSNCSNISYVNPLPVAVILVPTDCGLVLIRRGIDPGRGQWALPGGYIHLDETWQEAGAREVREETGIAIHPRNIEDFIVRSAPDGALLVFGVAPLMAAAELPPFFPSEEALERTLAPTPPPDMAFCLHRQALERYRALVPRLPFPGESQSIIGPTR